ncbi:MAG: hypothetical protein KAT00_01740 [Planctomycetes bacterium]|nr:hypothetical protein [Planctomycetota bacterium]
MVDEGKTSEPVVIRRQQVRQLIVLGVVILASGIVIGFGATTLCFKDRIVKPKRYGNMEHLQLAKKMRADYDLSEEQSGQLRELFKKQFAGIRSIQEESQQKMATQRQELTADIKEVLTKEQFDRWLKEFKAREKKSHMQRRQRQRSSGGQRQGDRKPRQFDGKGNGGPGPGSGSRGPGGPRGGSSRDHDAPIDRR